MLREKVLLVRAPNLYKSEQWKKQGVLRSPTNLALLASYIRERGEYEPEILDLELSDLKNEEEMAKQILSKGIKYVGFTTLTPRFPTTLRICNEIKKRDNKVVTVIGGPHISGRPEDCKYPCIDYGIKGEGEQAFLELLDGLKSREGISKIKNLIYKEKEIVRVNETRAFVEDLDSLPKPAWDLIELKKYLDPLYFEGPHVGVFTTRGCPYECIFCASKVTWKRRLRHRSLDNILEEFKEIVKEKGIKNLTFYDDQFATKKGRAVDLCDRIINSGLNINYHVQIRADSVTPELAGKLKESGCVYAAVGVETGNEEMLKKIKKRETKAQIKKGIRTLEEVGVPVISSYIIGLPGDTHETIQETLNFAEELDTEQMKFMLLTPVPGTEVYRLAIEKGILDPDNLEQMEKTNFYDSTAINLSEVSTEDLIRYQDIAYERFDKKNGN